MNNKIKEILIYWGLHNSEIKQIYDTAWQVGDDYVLKMYENPEMNAQYVSSDNTFWFLSKKLAGNNMMQINHVQWFEYMEDAVIGNIIIEKAQNHDTVKYTPLVS